MIIRSCACPPFSISNPDMLGVPLYDYQVLCLPTLGRVSHVSSGRVALSPADVLSKERTPTRGAPTMFRFLLSDNHMYNINFSVH
jgi:hypothetical protein